MGTLLSTVFSSVRSPGARGTPHRSRWLVQVVRAWACACAMAVVCGCSPPGVREASREATAGAVREGLGVLDDPRTKQRIAQLMASPEMQQTLRETAAQFATGVTGSMADEESIRRIDAIASAVAATAARAAIAATMQELSSAESERRMREVADAMVRATAQVAREQIDSEMGAVSAGIGPALGRTVANGVVPVFKETLDRPDMRAALSGVAFEMARQAVLGSNQAFADLERTRHDRGLLARLSTAAASWAWILAAIFVVCLAIIVAVIVRGRRPVEVEYKDGSESPAARTAPRAFDRLHRLGRHAPT